MAEKKDSEQKGKPLQLTRPSTPPSDLAFLEIAQVRLNWMKRHVEYLAQSHPNTIAFCYDTQEPPLPFKKLLDELGNLLRQLQTKWMKMNNLLHAAQQQPADSTQQNFLKLQWQQWQKETEANYQAFKDDYFELLKPDIQSYLQQSFTNITSCFDRHLAPTREELLNDASLKLLDTFLSQEVASYYQSASPSCFICYSWGNPTYVAQIHRTAGYLKQAGINVKLDIWHNTAGSVAAYIDLLGRVDYAVVMGTPDFARKWDNFVTGGASEGRGERDYRGNILAQEVRIIDTRMTEKPANSSGVIRVVIAGSFQSSFPIGFRDLPGVDLSTEISYCTVFFDLLEKLLPAKSIDQEQHRKAIINGFKASFTEKNKKLATLSNDELAAYINGAKLESKASPTLSPLSSSSSTTTTDNSSLSQQSILLPTNNPKVEINIRAGLSASSEAGGQSFFANSVPKTSLITKPDVKAQNLLKELYALVDKIYSANDSAMSKQRSNYLAKLQPYHDRQAMLSATDRTGLRILKGELEDAQEAQDTPALDC